MIHLLVLCKLSSHVDDAIIDELSSQAKIELLKIPEVLSVQTGRNRTSASEWPFFYAVDVESLSKLDLFYNDPIQIRFATKIVGPHVWSQQELRFEIDPGRDIRFS
jgi:hypothetical protein